MSWISVEMLEELDQVMEIITLSLLSFAGFSQEEIPWRIVWHKLQSTPSSKPQQQFPIRYRLDWFRGNDAVFSSVYELQPDITLRQWSFFTFGRIW